MNKKIFASIFCTHISLFAMNNPQLIDSSKDSTNISISNIQLTDSNDSSKQIAKKTLQPTSSNETPKPIELNSSSSSSSIIAQSRSTSLATSLLISPTYDQNDTFQYSSELDCIQQYQKNQILIKELLNRDASGNLKESLSCLVETNLALIKIIKCYSLTGYKGHYQEILQEILDVNQQILTKILENNHLKDDHTGMFSKITSQNKIFIEMFLSDIENNNKVTFLDMPPPRSNTSLTPSPDGL